MHGSQPSELDDALAALQASVIDEDWSSTVARSGRPPDERVADRVDLYSTNRTNLAGMTEIVNMHDAKTHFSKLVAKVEAGEEIVIARGGRPCARLVPIAPEVPRLGTMKDRWPELADEFFEALTGDELDAWDA